VERGERKEKEEKEEKEKGEGEKKKRKKGPPCCVLHLLATTSPAVEVRASTKFVS